MCKVYQQIPCGNCGKMIFPHSKTTKYCRECNYTRKKWYKSNCKGDFINVCMTETWEKAVREITTKYPNISIDNLKQELGQRGLFNGRDTIRKRLKLMSGDTGQKPLNVPIRAMRDRILKENVLASTEKGVRIGDLFKQLEASATTYSYRQYARKLKEMKSQGLIELKPCLGKQRKGSSTMVTRCGI